MLLASRSECSRQISILAAGGKWVEDPKLLHLCVFMNVSYRYLLLRVACDVFFSSIRYEHLYSQGRPSCLKYITGHLGSTGIAQSV